MPLTATKGGEGNQSLAFLDPGNAPTIGVYLTALQKLAFAPTTRCSSVEIAIAATLGFGLGLFQLGVLRAVRFSGVVFVTQGSSHRVRFQNGILDGGKKASGK